MHFQARLRGFAKRTLQRVTANQKLPPVVVSSIGRSGSTIVYDSVVSAYLAEAPNRLGDLGRRLTADWSWTLGEKALIPGTVYKTHDYPQLVLKQCHARTVFLFGSVFDAASSVFSGLDRFGEEWVKAHFAHLKSAADVFDLLSYDALGFEQQIKAWSTWQRSPTLCLRYEKLWENKHWLDEFLGTQVKLPSMHVRTPQLGDPVVSERMHAVFDPLDRRLQDLPDAFLASGGNAKFFDK